MEEKDPTPDRKTFDEECVEGMKVAAQRLLTAYPETRACICVWDYRRGLNDTQAVNGFWMTQEGPPRSPDELINGLSQTMRMLERMFMHVVTATQQLSKDTVEVTQALAARSEEYDKLESRIVQAKEELAELTRQIEEKGSPQTEEETFREDAGE